ncbi:hypothetical protein [Listeria seeligeri]|uniref:hypothetical protein n=1 Tax=Listeria seeligeri TaxID=1640 RepID=UPI0010D4D9BB|nr:hypothetical protein [Listeria seeligeri]
MDNLFEWPSWVDQSAVFSFVNTPDIKVYVLDLNELYGELIRSYVEWHHNVKEKEQRELNQIKQGWKQWVYRNKMKELEASINSHTKSEDLVTILERFPITKVDFNYPSNRIQGEILDSIMIRLDNVLMKTHHNIVTVNSLDEFTNRLYDLTEVLAHSQSTYEGEMVALFIIERLTVMNKEYQKEVNRTLRNRLARRILQGGS